MNCSSQLILIPLSTEETRIDQIDSDTTESAVLEMGREEIRKNERTKARLFEKFNVKWKDQYDRMYVSKDIGLNKTKEKKERHSD